MMALKMRKDIKKSSYYVWFLGAQESKGLRGAEYVVPVVKSLVQRERSVEPFKVTLQVSHKGLKIIQNVVPAQVPAQVAKSRKPEVVKHFIPHHAVTCVMQDVDVVSCILLLYNPVTKCPVHVHAYRCDSVETAEILKGQLQTLTERPDNQKKLGEIEARLRAKGLLPPAPARPPAARRLNSGGGGSDGRSSSTRESESSGGSSSDRLSGHPDGGSTPHQERITSLYDSLAAELREKLGSGGGQGKRAPPEAPILLPPRDYDTVHRQKGNLTAIDLRRCLNANIVGMNVKKEAPPGHAKKGGALGSSGGSSGIGSDHAPSPDQPDPDQRYLDNQSTSDEEWADQPTEESLFLVQPPGGGAGWGRVGAGAGGPDLSLPRARRLPSGGGGSEPPPAARRPPEVRQRSPSPAPAPAPAPRSRALANNMTISKLSPRDRFKDAKEKFQLLERERLEERERAVLKKRASLLLMHEAPISPVCTSPPRPAAAPAPAPAPAWRRSRDSDEEFEPPPPTPGQARQPEYDEDVFERGFPRHREVRRARGREGPSYGPPDEFSPERKPRRSAEFSPEGRHRRQQQQQEDFSPERRVRQPEFSPERRVRQPEFSPERRVRQSEYSPEGRRRQPEFSPERRARRGSPEDTRRHQEEVEPVGRYRRRFGRSPEAEETPPSRRPPPSVQDKKRRSMFDVVEEERKRSSHELAREFKRRSASEVSGDSRDPEIPRDRRSRRYHELSEGERFPGLDRETARRPDGRYRHSYAEPGLPHHLSLGQPHHEILHRTNSTLSSGRVGIAAIHPY